MKLFRHKAHQQAETTESETIKTNATVLPSRFDYFSRRNTMQRRHGLSAPGAGLASMVATALGVCLAMLIILMGLDSAHALDLSVKDTGFTAAEAISTGEIDDMPNEVMVRYLPPAPPTPAPAVTVMLPPDNSLKKSPVDDGQADPTLRQPANLSKKALNPVAPLETAQNHPVAARSTAAPVAPIALRQPTTPAPASVPDPTRTTSATPNVTQILNQLSDEMAELRQQTGSDTYTPPTKPSYAIFPVLDPQAFNKAYSDLPVMQAAKFATNMTKALVAKNIDATILNPIYSYDMLREKGLERIYQRLVHDYTMAGVPRERDLYVLTDALNTNLRTVQWVAFVETRLDMENPTHGNGLSKITNRIYEVMQTESNYFANSNLKVYEITPKGIQLVWEGTSRAVIKANKAGPITSSIFDSGNAHDAFGDATDVMAQTLLNSMPAHLNPSKTVTAKIAGQP
ncbi:MAG: hypothetical protein KC474_00255 [Cyanobacteria bacterium HKST-UBA04]|nr:hypothetical protein [Cyanobacteria bacterium HKST-UBA04]